MGQNGRVGRSVALASVLVLGSWSKTLSQELCTESPVNWTAVREDLVTYASLSEPKHRSRRCFGLDPGIWSYCGIAAMHLLQLQGNIVHVPEKENGPWEHWETPKRLQNPCPIGTLSVTLFTFIFLTKEERYGMLFHIKPQLDALDMSFEEIMESRWPIFGIMARLGEEMRSKGGARKQPGCSQRGVSEVLRQLQASTSQRKLASEWPQDVFADCNMGQASAHVLAAGRARLAGDLPGASSSLKLAEEAIRSIDSNYTELDWFSTEWPVFRMLHQYQFGLLDHSEVSPLAPDLVPRDPRTGRPLRFSFNRAFRRPDVLYIDIASDIIHTDLMRTLPAVFGIQEATAQQAWGLNFVYTSNDYHDLVPEPGLFRLQAKYQKLAYLPMGHDLVGEKDMQCKVYQTFLSKFDVSSELESQLGGMPRCFELPEHRENLRDYARKLQLEAERQSKTSEVGHRSAFVRKPEGAWGGRGVEIRFGVDDLLGEPSPGSTECAFAPIEDVQCLGLHQASSAEASTSQEACQAACCQEEIDGISPCEAWNWREDEGCWIGSPRVCSDRSPEFLGGWKGGQRLRGRMAEQRAVVQRYILDPVLYQLEGIHPPVRVKTDIRVYGTAISLDPLRLYISKHGYFRSGYLEKNYSATKQEDFLERLMHITHHIPKIEGGTYQCPTAPSAGDPRGSEFDAGSGGSLHKWFRIAEEQNGLDPTALWKTIKEVVALFILSVRDTVSCQNNPIPHACGAVGFHFFADLVVDSSGRAWLMEIHPTLAIKSHGLGDPEGGWVEVLTRSTRQGAFGTLAMFWAGWTNAPYKVWAESTIQRELLGRTELQPLVEELERWRAWQREMRPGWSGEEDSVAGLLAKALTEEHMSCRLDVEPLFPSMWREVGELVRPKPGSEEDPFSDGLRPFYRLYDLASDLLKGRSAPGDLRPERCEPIDFNQGTVWDQPWERDLRRFK